METAKSDNSLFKTIKLAITEYMGSGSTGNKFSIICRYINSDERINRKVVKMRKNSNVMIIGELTYLEMEFVVEIQDVNFLPCLLQTWKRLQLMDQPRHILGRQSSGRMSAQEIAKRATDVSTSGTGDTPTPTANDDDEDS